MWCAHTKLSKQVAFWQLKMGDFITMMYNIMYIMNMITWFNNKTSLFLSCSLTTTYLFVSFIHHRFYSLKYIIQAITKTRYFNNDFVMR